MRETQHFLRGLYFNLLPYRIVAKAAAPQNRLSAGEHFHLTVATVCRFTQTARQLCTHGQGEDTKEPAPFRSGSGVMRGRLTSLQ